MAILISFHLGESNRPLTPILLKSIAIRLPFLSRYLCKSMASSWQKVVHTPPICIKIRPQLYRDTFAEVSGSGVVGPLPIHPILVNSSQQSLVFSFSNSGMTSGWNLSTTGRWGETTPNHVTFHEISKGKQGFGTSPLSCYSTPTSNNSKTQAIRAHKLSRGGEREGGQREDSTDRTRPLRGITETGEGSYRTGALTGKNVWGIIFGGST